MTKSYLITVHNEKITGTQVMKVLQKLGSFVEIKDLPNENRCFDCKGSGLDFTLGQVGTCNTCGGTGENKDE